MVGDVYKGTVTAVLPSLQAAFVEAGLERTVFLQVRDMVEAAGVDDGGCSRNGRRPRHYPPIQELTKKGEKVLVQIAKEPIGTKGARGTTQLSFPGRFVVLVPGREWGGVSRKISSWSERRRRAGWGCRAGPTIARIGWDGRTGYGTDSCILYPDP